MGFGTGLRGRERVHIDGEGRVHRAAAGRVRSGHLGRGPRGEARANPCVWRRWLGAAALVGIAALCQAQAFAQTDVPSNWPLIPSNLNTGDEFRLFLRIQKKRNANTENIGDYDAYVQEEISAKGHVEIKAYSSHFQVLGSTATVNARTHTGTTGTGGVRIYWLNGLKLANNYADFYDSSWPNGRAGRTEAGVEVPESQLFQNICTGTADDGTTTVIPWAMRPCARRRSSATSATP